MTESSDLNASRLQEIRQNMSPVGLRTSVCQVDSLNDKIISQITEGTTILHPQSKPVPTKTYEQQRNQHHIEQISKQKQFLEMKLSKLNHSLGVLQTHDQNNKMLKNNQSRVNCSSLNKSFIKDQAWRKEIAERSKRIEEKKKMIQSREEKRKEQQVIAIQKVKGMEAQRKKQQLKQNVRRIQERTKLRFTKEEQNNEKIKLIKKSKKIFQTVEQTFRKSENQEIQERRRKLNEIRELYKPLNSMQLRTHEERFLQIRRHKEEEREKVRNQLDERARSYKVPYESVYYRRVVDNDMEASRQVDPDNRSKIREFSENVKRLHQPTIDEEKKAFFEDLKKKAELLKSRQYSEHAHHQRVHSKGSQYIDYMRKLKKKKNQTFNANTPTTEQSKPRYQNYLSRSAATQNNQKPWMRILNSGQDKQSKLMNLKLEAEKLEQKHRQKKKIGRVLKENNHAELDEEYFELVKAKLEIVRG